jgi:outer membrane protein W
LTVLIAPAAAFALAPRLRVGGGTSPSGELWLAETGVIASYRVVGQFEPYIALGFANYWINYHDLEVRSATVPRGPNQQLAARRGYGDGLLQGTIGFDSGFTEHWGVVTELRYWLPLQNDPGDRYRFVDSQIFAFAVRYQNR